MTDSKQTNPGQEIGLADQYRATSMLSDIRLVLALDDIWTGYLADAKAIPEEDIYDLQTIVEQMNRFLASCSANVDWLDRALEANPQRFESLWSEMLSRLPVDDKRRHDLQKKVADKGGFIAFARRSTQNMKQFTYEEISSTQKKIRLISGGKHSPGDLSTNARCALLGAATVVSVVALQFELAGLFLAVGAVECF